MMRMADAVKSMMRIEGEEITGDEEEQNMQREMNVDTISEDRGGGLVINIIIYLRRDANVIISLCAYRCVLVPENPPLR